MYVRGDRDAYLVIDRVGADVTDVHHVEARHGEREHRAAASLFRRVAARSEERGMSASVSVTCGMRPVVELEVALAAPVIPPTP